LKEKLREYLKGLYSEFYTVRHVFWLFAVFYSVCFL